MVDILNGISVSLGALNLLKPNSIRLIEKSMEDVDGINQRIREISFQKITVENQRDQYLQDIDGDEKYAEKRLHKLSDYVLNQYEHLIQQYGAEIDRLNCEKAEKLVVIESLSKK